MKFLLVSAALLLMANTAIAEVPGMQANLQEILNNRSAELNRRFETRLNQVIRGREMESAVGQDFLVSQPESESSKPGIQPPYLAACPLVPFFGNPPLL